MQPAHRAGNAPPELLNQLLKPAINAKRGLDAQILEGCHLGAGIGAVAMALHQLEIAIISLARAI